MPCYVPLKWWHIYGDHHFLDLHISQIDNQRKVSCNEQKNGHSKFPQGVITLTMIELHLCLHYWTDHLFLKIYWVLNSLWPSTLCSVSRVLFWCIRNFGLITLLPLEDLRGFLSVNVRRSEASVFRAISYTWLCFDFHSSSGLNSLWNCFLVSCYCPSFQRPLDINIIKGEIWAVSLMKHTACLFHLKHSWNFVPFC